MASITINPVAAGNIITDDAAHIWSGTLSGYTVDQTVFLTFDKSYGAPFDNGHPITWQSTPVITSWTLGGNLPSNSPDGVYSATATVGTYPPAPVEATETFILAAHGNTAFEAVGLAFIDVSTALMTPSADGSSPPKAPIYAALRGEQAGLTLLPPMATRKSRWTPCSRMSARNSGF